MLEKVTRGLDAMKQSGEFDKLLVKYNLQAPSAEQIAKYMPK